jgi:hypothetical protein
MDTGEEPPIRGRKGNERDDPGPLEVPVALPRLPIVELTLEVDVEGIVDAVPARKMDLAILRQ